ncbi:GNAT family N-acetyltransferase [Calidifontibacter sp. DB0510]|uniref:GNAT family N-acetyltransferase n=1 Tax=Metallococcus carri TaxID=1656884 RepID=A0A967B0M5_9MICO|nr:GNAT family N-acetyltransferase [Metallococcus carri]NHN55897.1 GNAT family N-acetyltransferase [Metallococcus carri]NOP38415.1 GNAT family N-acetyltransferase [Calidifontibacter sp. DB2511S]
MSDVTIRQAQGDDLQAVLYVGHSTWPPTYGPIAGDDYVAMGLAKWWTADATIPAIRAGRVTVAEVDGKVVGVATVGPQDGHLMLWKLYVLPGQQGHGIGQALMAAVLDQAREGGFAQVRLSYLDGNTSAARFYAKAGFEEFDRECGGSGLPDSVWVRRSVDPQQQTGEAR